MSKWEIDCFDLASIIIRIENGKGWHRIASFNEEPSFELARKNAKYCAHAVNCHKTMLLALKGAAEELAMLETENQAALMLVRSAIKEAENV